MIPASVTKIPGPISKGSEHGIENAVVIGGGPAGLSVAFELQARGVRPLVLESGPRPGASWLEMPASLNLITPWNKSVLFETVPTVSDFFAFRSAAVFQRYLEESARRLRLPVELDSHVAAVNRCDDGLFSVQTEHRQFQSRVVVNATGYYSFPHRPSIPGMESVSQGVMHSREYRDPARLRQRIGKSDGRILIVGKRITAGQLASELSDAGFDVSISARTRIEYARPLDSVWAVMRAQAYYVKENMMVARQPLVGPGTFPPMPEGRTRHLIEAGVIAVRPGISRMESSRVVFTDGEAECFDLVLLATGYEPRVDHLSGVQSGPPRHLESPDTENLFFVGYDKQYSFRSRFLRGIREDAKRVAERIHSRLDARRR